MILGAAECINVTHEFHFLKRGKMKNEKKNDDPNFDNSSFGRIRQVQFVKIRPHLPNSDVVQALDSNLIWMGATYL